MQSKIDKDTEVLIVYGLFDPYYSFLKEKKGKFLIFLEDQKSSYDSFLKKDISKKIIKDERVKIYVGDIEKHLKEIAWMNVFSKKGVVKSPRKDLDRFLKLKNSLEEYFLGVFLTFSDYADFKKTHFENLLINLKNSKKIKLAKVLKDRFKNIPAVIVGAAPSLKDNLPVLRKIKNKALIFAGGTAINILSKNNLKPHFISTIDQKAPFDLFKKSCFFDVPFIYQLRTNHKNFSIARGEKILAPGSGFELEAYFENSLKISQEMIETGWTVTTFLISFAKFLGCNPISFTGMDFCFSDNKYLEIEKKKDETHIRAKDIFGNDVFTQKDWLAAVKWIEDFALSNRDVKFYNANIGGIAINEVERRSLLEIEQDLIEQDLYSFLHFVLERADGIDIESDHVENILQELKESAKKCLKICLDAFSFLEKVFLDKGEFLFFSSIGEEIFYKKHLFPLWNIFRHLLSQKKVEGVSEEVSFQINKWIFFKNLTEDFLNKWNSTK